MAKLSKSRKLKMLVGTVMTVVMVISLFAGIGTIWTNEETNYVSASVLDGNGKFITPGSTVDSTDKGTNEDPFVVLEIVPQESMAQFGYLVGGQEPADLDALILDDIRAKQANPDATQNSSYLKAWLDLSHGDTPVATEFTNLISGVKYKKNKLTYLGSDLTWIDYADATQYGYYKKVTSGSGSYNLDIKESEIEGDGEDYGYYPETDPTYVSTKKYEDLTAEELENFDQSWLEGKSAENGDYIIAANGDIYLKVTEGEGTYSSKIYTKVDQGDGEYSLDYERVEDNKGDWKFEMADFNGYLIKYDLNGVSGSIEDQNIDEGDTISEPAGFEVNSVHDNCTLEGWYTDTEFKHKYTFGSEVTSDLTLHAKWMCKVVFLKNDGTDTIFWQDTVVRGTVVTDPGKPKWSKHSFNGWLLDGEVFDFNTNTLTIVRDTELVAKWDDLCTVTFNLNGAVLSEADAVKVLPQNKIKGKEKATNPGAPFVKENEIDGRIFKGWFIEPELTNEYSFSDNVTADIVLYAKWECKVVFKYNDGTENVFTTITRIKGESLQKPATDPNWHGASTPDEHHVFDKWNYQGTENEVSFPYTVEKNIVFEANWTEYCFVTFDKNGNITGVSGTTPARQRVLKWSKGSVTDPGSDGLSKDKYEF